MRITLTILLLMPLVIYSQVKENEWRKLSPLLQHRELNDQLLTCTIAVKDIPAFKKNISSPIKIIYEYPPAKTVIVKTTWNMIVKQLLPMDEVIFVDEQRKAKEEVAVSNLDLSTNRVNLVHQKFPQYNGSGITVSVKENRPDTADIDFTGRFLSTALSSNTFSTHATNMMTIIGGGGNSYYEGKGAAWGCTLSSSSFAVLLPDADAAYQQYNITVQNHSYGTSVENFYGADAMAYDASVITRPGLLHVFSIGNSGTQTSTTGVYANVDGFANTTGSFKMAKNIITVGHIDSSGIVLPLSSRGPAYDGRVKPELVAFGEDGSSGAAAIVSGISLTLQQAYKELHGSIPSCALIKAILLNSADDVGSRGIDFTAGFGSANAYRAMLAIVNNRYFTGSAATGDDVVFNLQVPPNIGQLKITLAWNDPAAAPNAPRALVNDLDLVLNYPAASQSFQPWVLNSFPHVDSLRKLPVRKRDSLNNVEQVTVDNPPAGNYDIHVKGYNVSTYSPQSFFVTHQFDTALSVKFSYPGRNDNIFGGRTNFVRWETNIGVTTNTALSYSIDNGATWQFIDLVDLSKGFCKWAAPDTFATAILRFSMTGFPTTDTFTLSKRFDVSVGFDCEDSFMLYWNKIPGVNSYQVYQLGNKYMRPLLVATDTFRVFSKSSNTSLYYAVAPVMNGKTGVRSYAYNYTTQGVSCYIKTFLGQLVNTTGILDLELGTNYQLKKITWQKRAGAGFVDVQAVNAFPSLHYGYTDAALLHGQNNYRVKIELQNGKIIYSEIVTLYFFGNDPYIIYPNPAPQYSAIQLLSSDANVAQLQVFNLLGMKVYEKTINDLITTIPAGKLSKGLYFLLITKDNQRQKVFKLIVY